MEQLEQSELDELAEEQPEELEVELDEVPLAQCGNGVLESGEDCDDGIANSDSTADACRSTCRLPSCGDGVVDSIERCDAGPTAQEGCSDCQVEENYRCEGSPSQCSQACPVDFIFVPAGTFLMGSAQDDPLRDVDELQVEITLTRPFCLAKHETTQAEFASLMGRNPSEFTDCGPSCPVESIHWHEAAAVCNALSLAEGLEFCYLCEGQGVDVRCLPREANPYECKGYRLPMEAEWEYSARADSLTALPTGETSQTKCSPVDPNLDAIAWYCGNSAGSPHPVMTKTPNAWGFYDMSGNVREWCHDGYAGYGTVLTDPYGSDGVLYKVLRGGGWASTVKVSRVPYRGASLRLRASNDMGLRLARTAF